MSGQDSNNTDRLVNRLDNVMFSKVWKAPYDMTKAQTGLKVEDRVAMTRYWINSSIITNVADMIERENGTFTRYV